MQYPCKLPKIQIDTWGQQPSCAPCSTEKLAKLLFCKYHVLVCMSLLRCNKAVTVPAIAKSIQQVRKGTYQAKVTAGQIYVQPQWRVRWEHMTEELQNMVSSHQLDVTNVFAAHYNADVLEQCIMSIIGPARAQGVACYLRWKFPREVHPTHPQE